MKRILVAVAAISLASPLAFAEVSGGDSRARGMGGAMTAVNDDMNTLFYNPAGLAYLQKNYLVAQADIAYRMGMGSMGSDLPEVQFVEGAMADYADSDGDGDTWEMMPFSGYYELNNDGSYAETYTDTQNGLMMTIGVEYDWSELTGEGGPLTGDYAPEDSDDSGAISDDEYYAAYERYRSAESAYNSTKYSTATFSPRLVVGGPHWGAALTGDYEVASEFSDYLGTDATLKFNVERRLAAVLGGGLNLGGIALGANLRYSVDAAYSVTDFVYSDDGIDFGDEFFTQLLNPESAVNSDGELAVGAGALFSLGTLNLGLYNDNVMPFFSEDAMEDGFFNAILDSTNLGLSWMPSDDKSGKKSPITLLVAADVNNLGDMDSRQLAVGAELGLNLFDFMVATGRLGYSQPLGVGDVDVDGDGKELWEMSFDDIDPQAGRLTAGITAKFWFAKVDLGVALPVSLFTFYATNNQFIYPDIDDPNDEYLSVNLTVSASF